MDNVKEIDKLWMRVISKAIDDLALFIRSLEDEKKLTAEDWKVAQSAYCFLFTDNHPIALDDYYVDIYCPGCDDVWVSKLSELTQQLDIETEQAEIECPLCKHKTEWGELSYKLAEEQEVKEITLEELLSIWNYNDLPAFRESAMTRVKKLVVDRRKALQTRKKKEFDK